MRHGQPRYVIFITGGDTDPGSKDLVEASQALRDLDVNIIALGINSAVSSAFLSKLATDSRFVFSAASADALAAERLKIEQEICHGEFYAKFSRLTICQS